MRTAQRLHRDRARHSVCYNALHKELDPYAVAYAVATLLNNLFGRSKEPFWQQPGRFGVYDVRKPKGGGWTARRHQLDAVERWCDHD